MKDIQEFLHDELPEGWAISRSASKIEAVVTGNLFTLTPPSEKPSLTPIEEGVPIEDELPIEEIIEDELPIENLPPGRPKLYSPKMLLNGDENENFHPIPPRKKNERERLVLFLYWITETKEILSATANIENPNVTAAIMDFAKDLSVKNPSEFVKDLKVALINTKTDSNTSRLITASVLEKMINAKTEMTFLDKSDTGKHDVELKKALQSDNNQKVSKYDKYVVKLKKAPQSDNNQKVSLDYLAKKFAKSTEANAALIINQTAKGHFDLELMELSSLNVLAIGRSENQPKE